MRFSGPGPANGAGDIAGLGLGHAEDDRGRTGVTVLLPHARTLAAVDVRGGGPGTRETDLLHPSCLVEAVDAIVLAGGSAYGLDAAGAVANALGAAGRGFRLGPAVVPIVPAAILFDLANGGDKGWGDDPPYRRLGRCALAAAEQGADGRVGKVGAGYGAKAGDLEGGFGQASLVGDGPAVAAIIAANPVGQTVMPGSGRLWAAAFARDREMGDQPPAPEGPPPPTADLPVPPMRAGDPDPAGTGGNTTIGAIVTDAALTRPEAMRLAMMAQDGIALAVRPAHTPFDGDTLFALATGAVPLPEPRARSLALLGAAAQECVARAIGRAVVAATPIGNKPTYAERHGHPEKPPSL